MHDLNVLFCRVHRFWAQAFRFLWVIPVELGCSSVQLVSVLPPSGTAASVSARTEDTLQIQVNTSSVRLPLRVAGADAAFTDVDRALHAAVQRALASTRQQMAVGNAQSYSLYVELIGARAEVSSGRITVQLTVRATLRQRKGNAYVAQTHAHANRSGAYEASLGVDTVARCADAIGVELQGWISGMQLSPVDKSE